MALPPWTIELLRRSVSDVAAKANPEAIDRIRNQATAILSDIPAAAARTVDSVMSATESRRESVRRWTRTYTAKSREVVNATGVLIDPPGNPSTSPGAIGCGIDADVLEAGLEFLDRSRVVGPGLSAWQDSVLQRIVSDNDVQSARASSLAIAVLPSLPAAVSLIPAMTDLPVRLHRSQAMTLPGGGNVPDLITSLGFPVTEFGSISGWADGDGDQTPAATVFVGPTPTQRRLGEGLRVDVLPVVTVGDNELGVPTIAGSFTAGADLVIAAIGGLIGGPDTAAVIGPVAAIERLGSHRTAKLFRTTAADVAMTLAALSRDPADVPGSAVSRASISIENLQSRADRIATRLRGNRAPVQTDVRASTAHVAGDQYPIASCQIAVRIEGQTGQQIAAMMQNDDPTVWVAHEEDSAIIDLRWVAPEQDASIR